MTLVPDGAICMMHELPAPDPSPAERRRMRVRAAILNAAEKVFAEEGEDGLSIRRLAEEIDYSPAAIYKYFGSKEELVDELKELFFERILLCVSALRESGLPYETRMRECVRGYVMTALERPQHYLAAFSGVVDSDVLMPAQSNKVRAFEFLIENVREGQDLGLIDTERDPVAVAKSVWACLHGAASLMAHMPHFPEADPSPSAQDREAFLDQHADVILKGITRL
ncbi:MAG: TetR/AcrR family transcriptional regulator [Hyphomonadaceae bacterium]|nr:TetR/AcrR family transcriptional regulator [Hyphomonadaceae bacterium]